MDIIWRRSCQETLLITFFGRLAKIYKLRHWMCQYCVSLSIFRNRLKLTKLTAVLYKIGVPAHSSLMKKLLATQLGHSRWHEEHTNWHVHMFKGANHHWKVDYNQSKGRLPPWLSLSRHVFCLFIHIYLYFIYLYFIFIYLYIYLLLFILIFPTGWCCLSSW
jgi:hypothetical protein